MEAGNDIQAMKRIFAEEITKRIHGDTEFATVQAVSQLLFDHKAGADTLHGLSARTLAQVAEEIPAPEIQAGAIRNHTNILDFLSELTGILPSRSEAKKAIQNNAISINKLKISTLDAAITTEDLLHGQFILVENGKKNKFLVKITR